MSQADSGCRPARWINRVLAPFRARATTILPLSGAHCGTDEDAGTERLGPDQAA